MGTIIHTCSFQKSDKTIEYTVRVLPWTHGKYVINIPYEVRSEKDGTLSTVAKDKRYAASALAQFQTKMTVAFNRGIFPIDLAEFMHSADLINDIDGMKVPRLDVFKCLQTLIPVSSIVSPSVEVSTVTKTNIDVCDTPSHVEMIESPLTLPLDEPAITVKDAPSTSNVVSNLPKVTTKKPSPVKPDSLMNFIDEMQNYGITFNCKTMLNKEGKEQYQKEVEEECNPKELDLAKQIRRQKRFLSDDFFNAISPAMKRICMLGEND